MEQNKQVVAVKAINDKLPDNLKVLYWGETILKDPAEQIEALRAYIRSEILKKFGIASVNKNVISAQPIGFNDNNVQTRLKLPKPLTRLNGDWAENLERYYTRVLPHIQQWLRNSLHNSAVTEEAVKAIL